MQFTLPSLIATLLVVGIAGCGDDRVSVPPDVKPELATSVDQTSAQSGIENTSLAADKATMMPELIEPEVADSGISADDAETTAVATQQPAPVEQPSSQNSLATESSEIRAENCMVQYINKVNVPAKAEGTLMELKFKEGDTINEGDVIAVIDDTAAKLAVELKKAQEKEAELNGRNEVNLKDAVNSEELAIAEYKAYKELQREGAIPFWEMEKKRLEAERARLRIELAEMQKKIAEVQYFAKRSEREIAEFELTRRQVTSPSTGFVEARIAQLGEWVQPGSPIATLIQMDRLRVEGDIDALRYSGQVLQGTPVQVLIYSESENTIKINGKLGFVSMEIDLNSKHRVWVEIENQKLGDNWMIKPGMRAEIVIPKTGQIF